MGNSNKNTKTAYLGLDLGRVSTLCCITNNVQFFSLVTAPKTPPSKSAYELFVILRSVFSLWDIGVLGIESPPFVRNPSVFLLLSSLFGAASTAAYLYDVPVVEINNMSAKKWYTGKGNASKDMIIAKTFDLITEEFGGDIKLSQHDADAFMYATYALANTLEGEE